MLSIEVIDEGIDTIVSKSQFSKALDPIDETDDGIMICLSEEHPIKAKTPLLMLIVKNVSSCQNEEKMLRSVYMTTI